jgi:NAD(P)H-hydrate repair Nnr-like enzyme with NAD(P)H-hydrate epimerase domain
MVGSSDVIVAIGGGDVGRDEYLAARHAGKDVRFIPADMNHAAANDKALQRGLAPPADYAGALAAALAAGGKSGVPVK